MNAQSFSFVIAAIAAAIFAMPTAAKCDDQESRDSDKRIRYLVEKLASKNAAPKITGDSRCGADDLNIYFRQDYDEEAQAFVWLALQQLLSEGEAAFDILLQHADDKRYAFSVNSYGDYNVTVGVACQMIVQRNIVPFEGDLHVITRLQWNLYPQRDEWKDKTLAEWWAQNKHRGLAAIQVEAIDATIAFMRDLDIATAPPWHPEATPLSVDEFNKRRDENLKTLNAIKASIIATGKPQTAKTVERRAKNIFGTPWSRRKYNK